MRSNRRIGATVAVAALVLATAACGGQDKPEVKLGSQATPSASPSPSASAQAAATKPTLPAVSGNNTAGRIAFAKYFVKAYNYAYATNDAAPIVAVGARGKGISCTMCSDLADYVAGQKSKGLHLDPSDNPIKRAFETARLRPNVWVVDIESSAPARADVDETGKKVHRYPAKKVFIYEVGVAWEGGHYRVTGWKAGENK